MRVPVPTGSTPICVPSIVTKNRPTGWNNVVFENVGMPHILYGLQGQQVLNHETHKLELAVPGQMAPAEFDKAVSDLVGFMVWMGEPQQEFRRTLGFFVLAFLGLLFVVLTR
jgi:ubiquinol-cytochrome c reductase cytochrome c1 subunit